MTNKMHQIHFRFGVAPDPDFFVFFGFGHFSCFLLHLSMTTASNSD